MLSFMHHFHVDFEMNMLFQAKFFLHFFSKNVVRVLLYNLRTKYFVFRFLSLVIYFFFLSRGNKRNGGVFRFSLQ